MKILKRSCSSLSRLELQFSLAQGSAKILVSMSPMQLKCTNRRLPRHLRRARAKKHASSRLYKAEYWPWRKDKKLNCHAAVYKNRRVYFSFPELKP